MNLKLLPLLVLSLSCSMQMEESETEATKAEEVVMDTSVAAATPSVSVNEVNFRTLNFLTGKMEVNVPDRLQPMDKRMFELKYPYEDQGSTIAYSDADATVTLLISRRQDIATQRDLPKYQQILNRSLSDNLSIDVKKSEIKEINGKSFIVIEMITPAVDTQVYNLMLVTNVDGRLLVSTFNCTFEKIDEWQPIANQIVNSMKIKE